MTRQLVALFAFVAVGGTSASAQGSIRFNDQNLFLSGGNVAWVNFARDVGPGPTDLARFEGIFEQAHEAGGNAMRLWLHTSGDVTPSYSSLRTGVVTGPGTGTIDDLEAILDAAWEQEIGLVLCLWSFDMLQSGRTATKIAQNTALLTDAANTQTYIDNALVPMVTALADHPAVIAWEVFNEPEGMTTEFGWTPTRVQMADVQRFINQVAGAIHDAAPDALVTNGSWSFKASSDVLTGANEKNYYSDAELVAAGGVANGTLDFYTVHYYEWGGTRLSPFHHDKDHWGLDKPLAITEFYLGGGSSNNDGDARAIFGVPYGDLYTTLYDRGYAGALGWQWYNFPNGAEGVENWPRMLENMTTMFTEYPAAVDVDAGLDVSYFRATPDGVLAGDEAVLSWSVAGAASVALDGVAVDATGSRAVAPTETTTYTLTAVDADDASNTASETVTVQVLAPNQINRALTGVASSSTKETCCGAARGPEQATDGDATTRWSSAWNDGSGGGTADAELDDDPDDEWLAVDLGGTVDVERVVLAWEAAYGSEYVIETSEDGATWSVVHSESAGDGGTDEILFAPPVPASHLRMRGVQRASVYGYSLWELEVYGVARPVDAAATPEAALRLHPPAPNPSSGSTVVAFELAEAGPVRLEVVDALGRTVAVLLDEPRARGAHRIPASLRLPSGLYVVRLQTPESSATRTLSVVR